MVFTVSGLRAGAAAFALGVALAGPQAAGVAAADRGDGEANSSPAAAGRADTRGGDRRDPAPGSGIDPTQSRGDESRSEGEPAVPAVSPEEPRSAVGGAESAHGEDVGPVPDSVTDESPEDQPAPESTATEVAGPDETAAGLRDTPRGPSGAPRRDAALPDAPRPAATLPDAPGPDAPGPDAVLPSAISTDGVLPAGLGEPAAPSWSLGSTGTVNEVEAVPEPTALSEPESPVHSSALQGSSGNQAVDTLRVRVVAVIDRVVEWLDRLPGGPFSPLTEFVSGALLLVRRAIVPEYVDGCAAAATTSGTDCGAGDGIPDWARQLPTSPWDPNGLHAHYAWYEQWQFDTWGSTLLRASKDVPMELDPGVPYEDDGVKGMVKNFSNQIVMVEMRRPLSVNGETRYDVYQAVLLPGDEMPFTLSQVEGCQGCHDDEVLYFYALDKDTGKPSVGPVRLQIVDDYWSRPDTAFAPANSDYKNIRTNWWEGRQHHEIWGDTRIWVSRDADGWQIPASEAFLQHKKGLTGDYSATLINNSAQSDWAVFRVYIDSL